VDEYTTRVYDLSTEKIKKLTIMELDNLSTLASTPSYFGAEFFVIIYILTTIYCTTRSMIIAQILSVDMRMAHALLHSTGRR
jgi:hypothetical protein